MPYEGRQLTILLHIDDLMISCEYQSGIDYVITCLNEEYSPANVYDTLTLDYIGMLKRMLSVSELEFKFP